MFESVRVNVRLALRPLPRLSCSFSVQTSPPSNSPVFLFGWAHLFLCALCEPAFWLTYTRFCCGPNILCQQELSSLSMWLRGCRGCTRTVLHLWSCSQCVCALAAVCSSTVYQDMPSSSWAKCELNHLLWSWLQTVLQSLLRTVLQSLLRKRDCRNCIVLQSLLRNVHSNTAVMYTCSGPSFSSFAHFSHMFRASD